MDFIADIDKLLTYLLFLSSPNNVFILSIFK